MRARATGDLPAQLERIQQHLKRWRQTRQGYARIPERLWGLAVQAAGAHGLNQTARALGLDYYSLKKRVEAAARLTDRPVASRGSEAPVGATFVELAPLASEGVSECLLEFERVGGAKLRVHLKGVAVPDLAALSQSFWSGEARRGSARRRRT